MDLKSGRPFWTVKNGLPVVFPPLLNDAECDVAVVGAGITGALVAHSLVDAGLDVIVLDKRDVAWGSTAASTALLQYEIDTELVALARKFGDKAAVMAYKACEEAIHSLAALAKKIGNVGFRPMRSLYLASYWHHARRLRVECAFRQHHGFAVSILERPQLLDRYGLKSPVALLTETAAQVDPYRMTYALLRKLSNGGARIFDRSEVQGWRATTPGIVLNIERDVRVRCKHLVIASGYESQKFLRQRVAANHSSYALVTEPVTAGLGPMRDTLLWESARPYLYSRTTVDGRILAGGEDDRLDLPAKRDAMIPRKSAKLMRKLRAMFPSMNLEQGFSWAGTFAETRDGLPYFGPHPQHGPRVHFAMAYGGNGIAFSSIGAEILSARILGNPHPLASLFSFERLNT